ncbi:WXG100 family type VII secretion target [Cellulomonas citrea]|uniref:WXG100 family type VII secretion target n=1 Tax=Cellulomonas citrea TaxID=1909423 RepID=UPI00135A65B0|nr:WXG100 family type VII secretion target [Cellulomonas citrea]
MTDVKVDPAALTDRAAAVATHATELGEELTSLQLASTAMTARWSGAAQEAYVVSYQSWAGQMRTQQAVLAHAASAATAAAAAYREADERVARLWGL